MKKFLSVLGLCIGLTGAADADVISESALAAVRAADGAAWDSASTLAPDVVTLDVVTWMRLRRGDQPFEDYQAFVIARPDWPSLDRIRARGEEALPKGTDPARVLRWFGDLEPETGQGAVRLAEALYARGRPELAKGVIETAWRSLRLTDEGQVAIVEAFPDLIAPLHAERADALLWRWRTDEVERMLDLMSEDDRALAEARVAYIRKRDGLADLVAAVPEALREDPGLAYDRFNWLADRGERKQASDLALARSSSAEALGEPFRWSGWRRSLARWEMRGGRPERAYALASNHFLTDGSAFIDLEWIAGYVALTYLDDPALALRHFETAEAVAQTPISLGRTGYWVGRAHEFLENAEVFRRCISS